MGTLLVVGPQGDVGCDHLVRLSRLCALQTNTHSQAKARSVGFANLVCIVADVLVGNKLPTRSSRLQRPCLQHAVVTLFHSSIFKLIPLLIILLTLAGGRLSEGNLYDGGAFKAAGNGIIKGIHVFR